MTTQSSNFPLVKRVLTMCCEALYYEGTEWTSGTQVLGRCKSCNEMAELFEEIGD